MTGFDRFLISEGGFLVNLWNPRPLSRQCLAGLCPKGICGLLLTCTNRPVPPAQSPFNILVAWECFLHWSKIRVFPLIQNPPLPGAVKFWQSCPEKTRPVPFQNICDFREFFPCCPAQTPCLCLYLCGFRGFFLCCRARTALSSFKIFEALESFSLCCRLQTTSDFFIKGFFKDFIIIFETFVCLLLYEFVMMNCGSDKFTLKLTVFENEAPDLYITFYFSHLL